VKPCLLRIRFSLSALRLSRRQTVGRVAGNALPRTAIVRSSPANELADEVRYRASQAGSAAIEILNAGASLSSRRQAMLYVTNGYDLDPPEVRVAEFASAAQRANVPVFAMNARGLRVRRHSLSRVTQPYGRAIAPLC
jgi:hypothetical protein